MIAMKVCLEIQNPQNEKVLAAKIRALPGISLVERRGVVEPDIFFMDDEPDNGCIFDRIRVLQQDCPESNLFVISSDSSPEHIVAVMKAGANEFFMKPINPEKISEAINRVQLKMRKGQKKTTGKAYAFVGSKGGLGTTALTVNLTTALAGRKSGPCTLLDLNLLAGDSSVLLDLVPKTTMTDAIRNFSRLDAAFLLGVMEKTAAGFDLLAAPGTPEESAEVSSEHIEKVLQLCRHHYEMAIVDCPAMDVNERALAALRIADTTFVVTDLSVPAVRNASRLLKLLRKAGIERTEVVVNRYIKGQASTLDEVEKTLGCRIFWLFPNDFESTMASINRGTPLLTYDPRSALARSINEFVQKLEEPTAFPQYRGAKGLLGKAV
jgi:pilus assembly protein CpaE